MALDLLEELPLLEPDVSLERTGEQDEVSGVDSARRNSQPEVGDERLDRRVIAECAPDERVGRAEEGEDEALFLLEVPGGLGVEEREERLRLDECGGRVGGRGAASGRGRGRGGGRARAG